jgi:hypothetical protein
MQHSSISMAATRKLAKPMDEGYFTYHAILFFH